MAVEYKFKPYTPTNLKMAPTKSQEDKTLKSLQSQRANLDARLRAEGIDSETLGGEFDNRNLLEKALNLTPDQGFLMDFFEVLDRPLQAVKNAVASGLEGEGMLKGFWEGISGQEEITGSEFLKDTLGIEAETGVGKFILDVGADILLDPLTYLAPGIILKGFSNLSKLGGKTIIRELSQEAIENSVKQVVKRFGEETLDAAKKIVADPKNSINNLEAAVKQVLSSENSRSLRKVYFFDKDFKDVDELVQFIESGGKEIYNSEQLPKRLQKMKKLLEDPNYINTLKGAGAQAEARYYKMIFQKIEKLDPNMKVILNNSSDIYDDVGIYYKSSITLPDGKKIGTLVQVDGIEVKQMVEKVGKNGKPLKTKPAFFSNNQLIFDATGNFSFGAKTTLKPSTMKKMRETFDIVSITRNGKKITLKEVFAETYTEMLNKVAKGQKPGITGMKISNIFKQTDDAGKAALRDLFKEMAVDSRINYTFVEVAEGSGRLVDVSEHLDKFDEAFDIMVDSSQGSAGFQFRFKVGFNTKPNANFLDVADRTEDFIRRLQDPGRSETAFITLAGRARQGDFGKVAQKISTSLKNFETNFKMIFNLTAGFSDDTKGLVKRALGENLFELERRSSRLSEISKELTKIDPEAGRLLGELIEAGAKIGPDGKITKLARRMGTSDFLDYVFKRTQDGTEILLPSFANEAAEKNFLKTMNKFYQNATSTVDDFFSVIKSNGGTALKFDGSADDMKELIKYFNESMAIPGVRDIPDYVMFGEKALSIKAKAFLQANGKALGEYRQLSDEILQELIDVAGFDNLPKALENQIGYMRHMMTREAYEGMRRQLPQVSSLFARPGSDALKGRVFIGSAEEVNAGLKAFMGLEMDLFNPNAFNAMEDLIKVSQRKLDQYRMLDIILTQKGVDANDLMRVVPNNRDFAKTISPYDTMFKNFKEEFSALYKNLSPTGQQRLDEFFKAAGYGADSAVMMNKSAYNALKGAEKAYIELPELVKIYDKFLNSWKGLTLVSPGFHLRNMFGNMFNSYAMGMNVVDQGKYLTTAVTELDQFQKIGKKLAQGLDISPAERKVFDTVRSYFEQGVSQTHRGIRDLDQLKNLIDEKSVSKLKTGYNNVLKFNFNVAEKSDDIQRFAMYRWSLDKTNDAGKAARQVSEALFDYSHLTPFEKDYMKRLFPFYTFMKNNFIFQSKNIFANPKQYARVGRAYEYAIEDLAGYSIEDLPDYAVENMWLPIPMTVNKNDKEAIAFLKGTLPLSDFTELVENPFSKGVTSLTAPVKLLIEFGAGRDLFTGAPLRDFPGQKNAMEAGTGVLSGLRDSRGNLTLTQSPLAQKILNDIGLRTPINFASAGVDLIDTLVGYQGGSEGLGDFMARAGIVGIQEKERLELTTLYQDLEKLRELKKYYEQETGNQLPVLPRG